jgi:hypothetical protein
MGWLDFMRRMSWKGAHWPAHLAYSAYPAHKAHPHRTFALSGFPLIFDHAGQRLGFFHPFDHMLLVWNHFHMVMLLVDFEELGMEMVAAALRELGYGVHPRCSQKFRILTADALKAKEVGLIDKMEQVMVADACFFLESLPAFRSGARFEQGLCGIDSGMTEFFGMGRSDAFDFINMSHVSGG